jgi:hypothetical protein
VTGHNAVESCGVCGSRIAAHTCVRPLSLTEQNRDLREFAAGKTAEWMSERMLRTKLVSAGERLLREPFSPAAQLAMREAIADALRLDAVRPT